MLYSPHQKPQQHGFKKGDTHIVISAQTNKAKAFSFAGELLWEKPCLPVGSDPNWRNNSGDTPPGLYKLGEVYNDYAGIGEACPAFERTLLSFGWISFDLIDLEGNEDNNGRAGIMMHGGGSGCGWPGAWEPYQTQYPTHGCIRWHNKDLIDFVLPLYNQGTCFVSVFQDDI